MALQVWLPLNGTLENKGLSNVTITNKNSTVDNNGKIGKCYKNTADGNCISLDGYMTTLKTYQKYSMCAWVYISELSTNHSASILSSGNWNGSDANLCFALCGKVSNGYTAILIPVRGNWNNSISAGQTLTIGNWYHICVTYDSSVTKLYINGQYKGSKNLGGICSVSNSNNLYIGAATYTTGFTLKGSLNDVRIYDHCLSPKEVKELSKALVVHYKLDNYNINNSIIYDCSGYGHNGTVIGTLTSNSDSPRYDSCISMNNTGTSNHIEADPIGVSDNIFTVSFWTKCAKSTNQVFLADPKISIGTLNSVLTAQPSSGGLFNMTNFKNNKWNHIVVIRNNTSYSVYINGISETRTSTNNYYTHTASKLWLLNRSYNNNYAANTIISDIRIYATELSSKDILELYNNSVNIDNTGNMFSYRFDEESVSQQKILKTGVVKINNLIEFNDKFKILSDGSVFLQILRHNNPASNLFTSQNCWFNNEPNLFSNLIILKDCSMLNNLDTYEFLGIERQSSAGTIKQVRWTQTSNPALSSTIQGYNLISGAWYNPTGNGLKTDNTKSAMHNSNVWWGACGCYTSYNGGIPGYSFVITNGYLELYIKIPEEILKGNFDGFLKFYKKSILATQLLEI